MNTVVTNKDYIYSCQKTVREAAQGILEHNVDITTACYLMYSNWYRSDYSLDTEEYYFLTHFHDEIEQFMSENRDLYGTYFLNQEEKEILDFYGKAIIETCQNIVSNFLVKEITFIENLIEDQTPLGHVYEELLLQYVKDEQKVSMRDRLQCLALGLIQTMKTKTLLPKTLVSVLEAMEEYGLSLENMEDTKILQDHFFKYILTFLETDQKNQHYVRTFVENIGPLCEELCEKSHSNWKTIFDQKRARYF